MVITRTGWPAAYAGTGAYAGTAPPIGRQGGQRLARDELAKAVYHPHQSFGQWLLSHAANLLNRFFNGTSGVIPGGWWAMVALASLAVVVVAVIVRRIGPVARSRRTATGALSGPALLTAREHREQAERNAVEGDYSAAILAYLRAIAAGLEERGVLIPDLGRTADELAAEAGRLLPGHAAELIAAARLFDDVCYGEQRGTPAGCERLRDLDAAIASAVPDPPAPHDAAPRPAVPA
jgi:Domain of unknown function (DUF4129)